MKRLLSVQAALKAPKNQRNSFGNYDYRSCEDILEAVKPLLKKEGLTLTLSDTLECVGDRYYVKATARISDGADFSFEVTAYAREEETRKGMDGSQITGAASSYARKYALNGLFLIDDSKDADATNQHGKEASAEAPQPITSGGNSPAPQAVRTKFYAAMKTLGHDKAATDKIVLSMHDTMTESATRAELEEVYETAKKKGAA